MAITMLVAFLGTALVVLTPLVLPLPRRKDAIGVPHRDI
ncbi:hypothetical protein jaqu_38220 [Jannaschia aquimarina]|uniref:Uncharacterized protein n=1 Tax=Jannaschia aquimarina TaxID=935700 RepID=A0A0D1CII2_9RHOB|nr:hypothetical protein jaqu_38220 [Jannaschia aquimarina]SNT35605.1 hypothetical protein SAMN05421775_112130 [Jannaschia aquimarina]